LVSGRITTRLAGIIALAAIAIAAVTGCGGSDGEEATVTPAGTATPETRTPIERLTAAYADPIVDPSEAAWTALLADPGFATQAVAVAEFVALKDGDNAKAAYDAYLDALVKAVSEAGGEMVSVNDTLMPGIEGLEPYEGGVSWVATFPSISAYVDALLDQDVVAVAARRAEGAEEAQVLVGPNLVPDVIKQLGPNTPASDFPSDRVQGKTTDQILDELLAIYPSGGADPPEATLRRLIDWDGFQDQRVHYINLYRFNDAEGGGEQALGEYNAAALPVVLAHGGRPKVLANVTHHLVGPTAWDRFIFVSWPSFAVFTDLRLDPTYIEAQKDRVASAEQYGNLVTVARGDQPTEP
jgi:uncharacterized protein (DUF1330 family)